MKNCVSRHFTQYRKHRTIMSKTDIKSLLVSEFGYSDKDESYKSLKVYILYIERILLTTPKSYKCPLSFAKILSVISSFFYFSSKFYLHFFYG